MVKSRAVQRAGSSAIRELLELTERPGVVSLAGGLPNPATFPTEAMGAALEAVRGDPATWQYGPTQGHRPLREQVATSLDASGGVCAEHVQITSGAQQALDLTFRALVDPGELVAVGEATYVGARQALRAAGIDLAPIPTDDHGLQVEVLAERLVQLAAQGRRIAAVYVVSNFDNPTGATLSEPRRRALVEVAERFGFWIVDDDPYGALRWAGTAPAALRGRSDRVITVGTTSKVLCPGLRVGWVAATPEVRAAVTQLKQASDLHTSSLDQRLVAHLLAERVALDDQVHRARARYQRQCGALVDALGRHLGASLQFSMPAGGLFVWARLRDDVAPGRSTADLLTPALEHGVAFVPGEAFAAVSGAGSRHLRLSFATTSPTELDEGVRRLAAAVERFDRDAAQ